jgi:putative acetyltransferase
MFAIRRASLSDAAAIHRVHMASIRALARSHYSAEQVEAWCGRRSPESYLDPIERKVVLVAEKDHLLCGFAQLDPLSAAIDAIYVAPDAVRRGIGTKLLAEIERSAAELGIKGLSLDSSLNAVAFYASAGYSPIGEADHKLELGGHIPCVTMYKALRANAGA